MLELLRRERKLLREKAMREIEKSWEEDGIPALTEYGSIPNKSKDFDPAWETNGHMEQAAQFFADYAENQKEHLRNKGKGVSISIERAPDRSPLLIITAPGKLPGNTLIYGHLDKQPEGGTWSEGLEPWKTARKGDGLYGRGMADDGYALPMALAALRILDQQGVERPTCTIIIESGEESGSPDMSYYLDTYAEKIGTPDTIICLDSGAGDYERPWLTESLRGNVIGVLEVESTGGHSGDKSGEFISAERASRIILSNIENVVTGEITLPSVQVEISEERRQQIEKSSPVIASGTGSEAIGLCSKDSTERQIRKTWKAMLTVTGMDGLPPVEGAGNTQHPKHTLKLSLRIPPGVDAAKVAEELKEALEKNPPHDVKVKFTIVGEPGNGWDAPPQTPKLKKAIEEASQTYFGEKPMTMGEGGSIPLMNDLQKRFPKAQFVITGVLGPGSNAHGPDERLDIPYTKKQTAVVAEVIAASGK